MVTMNKSPSSPRSPVSGLPLSPRSMNQGSVSSNTNNSSNTIMATKVVSKKKSGMKGAGSFFHRSRSDAPSKATIKASSSSSILTGFEVTDENFAPLSMKKTRSIKARLGRGGSGNQQGSSGGGGGKQDTKSDSAVVVAIAAAAEKESPAAKPLRQRRDEKRKNTTTTTGMPFPEAAVQIPFENATMRALDTVSSLGSLSKKSSKSGKSNKSSKKKKKYISLEKRLKGGGGGGSGVVNILPKLNLKRNSPAKTLVTKKKVQFPDTSTSSGGGGVEQRLRKNLLPTLDLKNLPKLDLICSPCATKLEGATLSPPCSPLAPPSTATPNKEDEEEVMGESDDDDDLVIRIEKEEASEIKTKEVETEESAGSKDVEVSMWSQATSMFQGCFAPNNDVGTVHSDPNAVRDRDFTQGTMILEQEERAHAVVPAVRSWPRTTNDIRRDTNLWIDQVKKEAATKAHCLQRQAHDDAKKEAANEIQRAKEKADRSIMAHADELKWMKTNLDNEAELNKELNEQIANLMDEIIDLKVREDQADDELDRQLSMEEALEEACRDSDRAAMRIDAMSQDLRNMEAKLKSENQTNWALTLQIATLKQGIADARAKQAEMERVKNQAVEVARQAKEQEEMKDNSRSEELARLKAESEQNSALKSQIIQLKQVIVVAREHTSEELARLKAESEQNSALKSQIIQLKQVIAEAREQTLSQNDTDLRIASLEHELAMERRLVSSTEKALKKTREHLSSGQGQHDMDAYAVQILQEELERKVEELELERKVEELSKQETVVVQEQTAAAMQIETLQAQADSLAAKLKVANDNARKSEQQLREYEATIDSMQGDIVQTSSTVEAHEVELAGLKEDVLVMISADGSVEYMAEKSEHVKSSQECSSPKFEEADLDIISHQLGVHGSLEELKKIEEVIDNLTASNSLLDEVELLTKEDSVASQTNTADKPVVDVELKLEGVASRHGENETEEKPDDSISFASSVSITSINIGKRKVGWFRRLVYGDAVPGDDDETLSTMGNQSQSTFGASTIDTSKKAGFLESKSRTKKWAKRRERETLTDMSTLDSHEMDTLSENSMEDHMSTLDSHEMDTLSENTMEDHDDASDLSSDDGDSASFRKMAKKNSRFATRDTDMSVVSEYSGEDDEYDAAEDAISSNSMSAGTFDSAMDDNTFSSELDTLESPKEKTSSSSSSAIGCTSSCETDENEESSKKNEEGIGGISSWFSQDAQPLSPLGRVSAFLVQ